MLSWRDWRFLYFDHKGRITRQSFWFGCVPLLLIAGVILPPLNLLLPGSAAGWILTTLLLAWPAWCLAVKRRHDRGANGVDLFAYPVLLLIHELWHIALLGGGTAPPAAAPGQGVSATLVWLPEPPATYKAYGLLVAVYSLYLLVMLGFAPGTNGPNRYGPDPLASRSTTA
jgi:uncharacterized membrane protein YhaH (DUF805 family)